MTVEVDGKKYRITWYYDTVNSLKHELEHTVCLIHVYTDRQDLTVVSIAGVTRHYLDKYDKNKARKISLSRALQDVQSFGKKERTEIWNAYAKMRNGKW